MQNQTITKPGYKFIPHIGEIPEDWKLSKMKKITEKITNGFVGKATDYYVNSGGITYIQGFNVNEYGFNLFGIKQVSRDFHSKNIKSELKEGDLLTIQTGDIGVTSYLTKDLEGSNCHALIISRFIKSIAYSKFYYFYFNSYLGKRLFKRIETGSTMKHLNCGDMEVLHLPLPKLDEQIKISNILDNLNNQIVILQNIIDKVTLKNKGLKQQLFLGKKRVNGFNKDWKTIHIRNIGFIPQKSPITNLNGEKLLTVKLHNKGIIFNKTDTPILSSTGRPYYKRFNGEILIGRQNFHNGGVGYVSKEFDGHICSNAITSFIVNKEFDTNYILYLFGSSFFYKKIENSMSGTGQKELSEKEFLKIKIKIPEYEEQLKISKILNNAYLQLNYYKSKLDKLELLKKGLMQQLLTGKTRVKI